MSLEVAENTEFGAKRGRFLRKGLVALVVVSVMGATGQYVIKPALKTFWEPALVMSTQPLRAIADLEFHAASIAPDLGDVAEIEVPELEGYEEKSIRSLAPARAPRITVAQRTRTGRTIVDTFQDHAAAPKRVMTDAQANEKERAALVAVYRNLKRQFIVSLISDKLPVEMASQTALASLDPIPTTVTSKKWIVKPQDTVEAPAQAAEEAPVVAVAETPTLPTFDPAPALQEQVAKNTVTTQAPQEVAQAVEKPDVQKITQLENRLLELPPARVEIPPATAPPTDQSEMAQAAPSPKIESPEETAEAAGSLAQMSQKLASLPRISTSEAPRVVTPPASNDKKDDRQNDYPPDQNTIAPAVTTQFTEFFDPRVMMEDAYATSLTQDHRNRGWSIANSNKGYPSLYWVNGNDTGAPILSKNSAEILARSAGISMNDGTAIVMGRVPRGYRVDFSSRTDRVLYINDQRQITDEVDVRTDRDFILFNAKPGFEIVSFASAVQGQGGVAIPLLSGHTTYVDLRKIEHKSVSGQILLAANPPRAISGVQVQIIGQQSAMGISARDGSFEINRVLTIQGMDLFVETKLEDGFAFRYSVGSDQTTGLDLYRLTDADISTWVDQLEGGVSEQSGLIIAAMPQFVSNARSAAVPSVQTLAADPVLAPEVYGLTPEGQLVPQGRVDVVSSRVLSVQIPEGPTRLAFEAGGSSRASQWSTLVPTSPRVIHLVSH